MEIGERIKMLRKAANLTQPELGEMLGVKKAAIQKYESGSIINLKVETLNKLGEIFKVSPSFIMGWDDFDERYDTEEIKKEIKLAELVSEIYVDIDKETLMKALTLNHDGIEKLTNYVDDLAELKKYQK